MFSSLYVVLAVALSALAISVTSPTNTSGWQSNAVNTITWNRVDTDPTSFAVFLVNQDATVLPGKSELLIATVDATQGSISVTPPSGGFPVGNGYQVNFCQDSTHPTSILAQSNQFNITSGGSFSGSTTSTSSSSGSTSGASTTGSSSSFTTLVVPPPAQTVAPLNPTNSGNSSSAASNGALGFKNFEPRFLGAVVLLGAFLA